MLEINGIMKENVSVDKELLYKLYYLFEEIRFLPVSRVVQFFDA